MSRPNLLIFMPDQLRADAVACFGNPVVQTPNIDALAARGTMFRQAFSQSSVCSQSRVSLLTGWYLHTAGHRTLDHLLKPHEPNLLRQLKQSGYHVAWSGKRGDTMAPGVTTESTDFHGFTHRPTYRNYADGGRFPHDSKWAPAFYEGMRPASADGLPVLDFDEAAVRTACDLLTQGMPEPWVLFIALVFPHPPFEVEEPWFSMYDRADVPAPTPPMLDDKPKFMRDIRETYELDRLDDDDWAEIIATYYGMVTRVDSQLGRVVECVDKVGATDRTAVAFFTDHGEWLGDKGLIEKWPTGLDDVLVRNPFILSIPGQPQGNVCDGLVEMVDFLPTVHEMAEIEPQHDHFGRSLFPLLTDPTAAHREAAYSEGGHVLEPHTVEAAHYPYDRKTLVQQRDPKNIGKAVAMRTQHWTYIHRLYDIDELYDRQGDPNELINLSGRAEYADVERAMRDDMLDWLLATGDVVPWEKDPRFPRD